MNHGLTKALLPFIRTRIVGRPNLRKILSNSAWLFGDYISRYGLGFLMSVWIARYLGPEQFGLFNYATAFAALFAPLATLGLNNIVVRDIVRDPSCRDETLGTVFVLKLISALLTWVVIILAISLIRPQDSLSRWMVSIIGAGTIFQAFDTIDYWFQSQVKSKFTVLAKNAAFIIGTLIRVALIQMRAPLLAFAYTALLELILGAGGLIIAYRTSEGSLRNWQTSLKRAKSLLRDSWPLLLSWISIMIYMKIDQIMLGEMIGDQAVGIYSVVVTLSEVWYFIPMVILSSLLPSVVEAKKTSEQAFRQRMQQFFNFMSVIAYSIAIPMTFLSDWLVRLLFGEPYAAAGPVLAIHIWAGVSVFLAVAREAYMIAEGLMKFSFAITFGGAVINVVLNCFLIPAHGALGAAIATVIAYSSAGLFLCFLYARTRPVGFMMLKSLVLWK
jgi:O-antigen/teichoic acid export membrane protein